MLPLNGHCASGSLSVMEALNDALMAFFFTISKGDFVNSEIARTHGTHEIYGSSDMG